MSAGQPVAQILMSNMPAPEWRFTGASVLGASTTPGVLWQHRMTGDLARWLIGSSGTSWSDIHIVDAIPQNWEVISY
jgi:hypothetical protein